MAPQPRIKVAICICTFRRRTLLRQLLNGVAQLRFRKVSSPELKIIIVDNDEFASAQEVCKSVSSPWPIEYVLERNRGITYARNRAIVEAGSVDFVAFIDDDEVPSSDWLDELLSTQSKFSADVVTGPVLPCYAPEIASWIKRGRFFGSRSLPTGTLRGTCASNNVLIAAHVFRAVPGFDHSFAVSGAEDTNFFLRVMRTGYKIVWCQEASVVETVPATRGIVTWILRREYQTGNGWVFCESEMDNSLRRWITRFFRACGHVVIGFARAILSSLALDRPGIVHALRQTSLGTGMLAGLAGIRFLAYRDPNSTRNNYTVQHHMSNS